VKLSKNFDSTEFACPHCKAEHIEPALVTALQQLRDKVGHPISILSGYRCVQHNKDEGGAKDSQHIVGKAADVTCPAIPLSDLYDWATTIPDFMDGGIGVYPKERFIHVDVRNKPARWGKVNGKYVAIQVALKALVKIEGKEIKS